MALLPIRCVPDPGFPDIFVVFLSPSRHIAAQQLEVGRLQFLLHPVQFSPDKLQRFQPRKAALISAVLHKLHYKPQIYVFSFFLQNGKEKVSCTLSNSVLTNYNARGSVK